MRTKPAVTVGVLGVLIIVIGRVFGLVEMYVMGTSLVIAAIVAVVFTRSRIVLVDVERRPTHTEPRAGEEVGIELTVRALRRSPSFDLSDRIVDSAGFAVGGLASGGSPLGQVEISVPPLRRGQQTISRYRIRAEHRGVITLGPALVEFGDPLGLSRRVRPIGRADEVIVCPDWTPIALPSPRQCEGELVTAIERITRNRASELEFRSLREYAPGDDVRFVNWRASARRDVLIVNEFESHARILLDVMLDDSISTLTLEGFERAISVAASFAGSASLTDEDDVRVHMSFGRRTNRTRFDSEIDETTRRIAMRSLAVLTLSDSEPEIREDRDRTRVRVPVLICGRRTDEWLDRTQRAMQGSGLVVVIACEGSESVSTPSRTTPSGWFLADVADFHDFAEQWARFSRRIQDS
jgi:uncharacterized protein (DUF58 family)